MRPGDQGAEAELTKVAAATRQARRPLRCKDAIGIADGKVINTKKVAKHFITEITDDGLTWRRDEQKIAEEAALDGIYVIRTSLPADTLGATARRSLTRARRTWSGCSAA